MRNSSRRLPGFFLMALAALAGCGRGGPSLVPVEGSVTLDGAPLGFADLNFVPEPGNTDVTPGAATTDEDGRYRARYQGRFGLGPGTYKVTLRKVQAPDDLSSLPVEMQNDPAQLEMSGLLEQTLPDAYADLSKTSFTIDVRDGGGPYDFDLDSEGR